MNMPMPAPPLDGVPPSPPEMGAAGGPNPTIQQMSPSQQMGGDMQVIQMTLQAASQAASLIDLIGQAHPAFAPTAQMLIQQLRGGLKAALQQGPASTPEPSAANPTMMMQGMTGQQ